MNESKNVLVSVYILSYNHEAYIRHAIESILMQKTDFRFELIIHDDASTDNSAKIIREYESKYPDIITAIYQTENQFSKKNVGLIKSFILPIVKGKYIAICEGDDYWTDENKLQKQVDFLEANKDYSAVGHNVTVVDENEIPLAFLDEQAKSFSNMVEHDYSKKEVENGFMFGQTASRVYRNFYAELPKEISDAYHALCHTNGDVRLSLMCYLLGKVKCLPDVMAAYRRTYTGTSYNARVHGKNLNEKFVRSYLELQQFCKLFDSDIDFSNQIAKKYGKALSFYIKKPTKENREILKFVRRNCKRKVKGVLYFVKEAIDYIPYLLRKKHHT